MTTDHPAARLFPFNALGLERNPFGALTDEEWVTAAVLPPSVEAARAAGFEHMQVIGQRGRGKSTILRALVAFFEEQGERVAYERLPQGQARFYTDLHTLDRFALDEAQRLGWRARRDLQQAARGGLRLILGSHTSHHWSFARQRLPLLTIRLHDDCSPAHLAAVLDRRLALCARDGGPLVSVTPDAIEWLWQRFGSDLRGVEFFLYEVFQALDSPGPLTADTLNRQISAGAGQTSHGCSHLCAWAHRSSAQPPTRC